MIPTPISTPKDIELTDHFHMSEVIASSTASRAGIDNSLPTELFPAACKTALGMEKVRACLDNKPISIDSWYRCLQLNQLLKSKDTSQHRKAEAVDFICPAFGTPLVIAKRLLANKDLLRFNQLILEHTWIHIAWNSDPTVPQKLQVLSLLSNGGYAAGLTNLDGVSYVA